MSDKTMIVVDYASGPDKAVVLCLLCYREDCEHIQSLRRISAQIEHEGVASDIIQEPPFFTPSPAPTSFTAYHNTLRPSITSEGIQEAVKRLRELRAKWDKENAEILAGLPMREPLQPRMPNFCPNDHNCFPGYPCAICDGMGDV